MRNAARAAALLGSAFQVGTVHADDDFRITDEPLELTTHMHWDRAQAYDENYSVEQAAREMTGIHLIDATAGKNTVNTSEALNL